MHMYRHRGYYSVVNTEHRGDTEAARGRITCAIMYITDRWVLDEEDVCVAGFDNNAKKPPEAKNVVVPIRIATKSSTCSPQPEPICQFPASLAS